MATKVDSADDLSKEAVACRADRHVWPEHGHAVITAKRNGKTVAWDVHLQCMRKCGTTKVVSKTHDGQTTWIIGVKYSHGDHYLAKKGVVIDRGELRYRQDKANYPELKLK